MMELRLNGQNLQNILTGAPVITDQLEAVCRTLTFSVINTTGLDNDLGQSVELWYHGKRWFKGDLKKRGCQSDRGIDYTVNDPLFYLGKNADDWYFKNSTAVQDVRNICLRNGIKAVQLDDTKAVLPSAYYQNAAADKVLIDRLVRTYNANKKRFWFRYDAEQDGLILFEKKIPDKIWTFQTGINLISADQEESIEETITTVKLINRETGEITTKVDEKALKQYGYMLHFEEVDKSKAKQMDSMAASLLKEKAKTKVTMKAEGINPNAIIPQLYSGDAVYIEEKYSGLLGGYYIRNITQTFVSEKLIKLSFDLEATPDVPTIQFNDAESKAKEMNKNNKSVAKPKSKF